MVRLIRTVTLHRGLTRGPRCLRADFNIHIEPNRRDLRNGSGVTCVRKGDSVLILDSSGRDQSGPSGQPIRFLIKPSVELLSRVRPSEPGYQWLFLEPEDGQDDLLVSQTYSTTPGSEDTWIVEVRATMPAKVLWLRPKRPRVRLELFFDGLEGEEAENVELILCDADERRTQLRCLDSAQGLFGEDEYQLPSKPGSARLTAFSRGSTKNKTIPLFERAVFLKPISKENQKTVQARLKLNEEERQALAEQGAD